MRCRDREENPELEAGNGDPDGWKATHADDDDDFEHIASYSKSHHIIHDDDEAGVFKVYQLKPGSKRRATTDSRLSPARVNERHREFWEKRP